MREPKHPHIHVRLVGQDGNAFYIIGSVTQAMRRAGLPKSEIDAFIKAATAGDYDHLLQVVLEYVDCE